jgi:hypothetical protein
LVTLYFAKAAYLLRSPGRRHPVVEGSVYPPIKLISVHRFEAVFFSSAVNGGVGRLTKISSKMKTSTSAFVFSFSQNRSICANQALIDESKSAGLLHSFTGLLVQAVLLQEIKQGEFVFAEALFHRPCLFFMEAVHQFNQSVESLLDRRPILFTIVVGDDLLVFALVIHSARIAHEHLGELLLDDVADILNRRGLAPLSSNSQLSLTIAAICCHLGGIPLAIEFAAARAATLGVEQVAVGLHNRFELLTNGRRTALPRHRTLRATLDWSYALLAAPECVVLRRLGVFASAFSLKAASAVVASAEVTPAEVVDGLSNLIAKSLVAADVDGTVARYRLLDTTRVYALEKLAESGELDRLARRHAEYYRDLFELAETEAETQPAKEWLADYGRQIDNLRSALDWAFSPNGDPSTAVALTAAAVPLWMYLSLMTECHSRVEQAIAALGSDANPDARREMKLHAALGASLLYTRSPTGPEYSAAWAKALEIAEGLDDVEYQLRSLWGLWSSHIDNQHRVALALAERFCTLAANRPDPNDRLIGDRLIG